jgi:hypothetical protein
MRTSKEIKNSAPERYEAPELEIIEVEAEKGFAASPEGAPVAPSSPTSAKPARKY